MSWEHSRFVPAGFSLCTNATQRMYVLATRCIHLSSAQLSIQSPYFSLNLTRPILPSTFHFSSCRCHLGSLCLASAVTASLSLFTSLVFTNHINSISRQYSKMEDTPIHSPDTVVEATEQCNKMEDTPIHSPDTVVEEIEQCNKMEDTPQILSPKRQNNGYTW